MNLIARLYARNATNAFGYTMELVANILGSSFLQTIINVAFSVYTAFYFANNPLLSWSFAKIAAVYLLLLIVFIYLNERRKRKKEEAESLADVSTQLQKLVFNRMQTLDRECVKYIQNRNEFDTNIESEADFVCDALYMTLSKKLKYENLEVVMWQLMPDLSGMGSVAHPVSFGTKGNNPPKWFNDDFSSNDDHPYRILECFQMNKELIFLSKEECQCELVFKDKTAKKKSRTTQYIALPIRKRDGFTSAVIQFRTFREKIFPVQLIDVEHIIDNWVAPFTNFYELSLEEQNVIEEILDDEE